MLEKKNSESKIDVYAARSRNTYHYHTGSGTPHNYAKRISFAVLTVNNFLRIELAYCVLHLRIKPRTRTHTRAWHDDRAGASNVGHGAQHRPARPRMHARM